MCEKFLKYCNLDSYTASRRWGGQTQYFGPELALIVLLLWLRVNINMEILTNSEIDMSSSKGLLLS